MSNARDCTFDEERRDDAEEGMVDNIVKLADSLAEREELRNEFNDRLRNLRDKMIHTKKIVPETLEVREQMPMTSEGGNDTVSIFELIRQRCLKRKELAENNMILLHSSTRCDETIKLQQERDQARVDLRCVKENVSAKMSRETFGPVYGICDARSQAEVQAKDQQIEILQLKLAERDRRLRRLTEDLAEANRRSIELEVKLEVHDFKFVSYQKYRKELDKQSLQRICEDTLYECSSQESESSSKQYTGKLVADLEEMEKMYISAKQEANETITKLLQESSEYRAKIKILENLIESAPNNRKIIDCSPETHYDRDEQARNGRVSNYILTRMELLESENAEYNQTMSNLTHKLENTKELLSKVVERYDRDTSLLSRKAKSLEDKIVALKAEMKSLSGEMAAPEKRRQYHILEKNLDEYLAEISRLEERLRTKERIISRLRCKSVEKRLAVVSIEDVERQHNVDDITAK